MLSRHAIWPCLLGLGNGTCAKNAASACATAFVLGQLVPFGATDIMAGVDADEREISMAIAILCLLAGNGSKLLWPAVLKGLQNDVILTTLLGASTPGFCRANRAPILLEFGCREGVLSSMGNRDLLLDKA